MECLAIQKLIQTPQPAPRHNDVRNILLLTLHGSGHAKP